MPRFGVTIGTRFSDVPNQPGCKDQCQPKAGGTNHAQGGDRPDGHGERNQILDLLGNAEEDGRDAVARIGAIGANEESVDTGSDTFGWGDGDPVVALFGSGFLFDKKLGLRNPTEAGDGEVGTSAGGDINGLRLDWGTGSPGKFACGKLDGDWNGGFDDQFDGMFVADESDVKRFAKQAAMLARGERCADGAGLARGDGLSMLRLHVATEAAAGFVELLNQQRKIPVIREPPLNWNPHILRHGGDMDRSRCEGGIYGPRIAAMRNASEQCTCIPEN